MRCSHCGICCEKTGVLLSNADVERLEKVGYNRQKFTRYDKHGFARLRNCHGFCVFYDVVNCRCKIYKYRTFRMSNLSSNLQRTRGNSGGWSLSDEKHRLGNRTQKKR